MIFSNLNDSMILFRKVHIELDNQFDLLIIMVLVSVKFNVTVSGSG